MIFADDFSQIVITKFDSRITQASKEIHKNNIEAEINKQNQFEKKWKISTNIQKFCILNIGFFKAPNVIINNSPIPYSTETKLLGLNIADRNFYVKHSEINAARANAELQKLYKFKRLSISSKLRLYKALIRPLLTYPVIPLNILSNEKLKRLQVAQNNGIRWIMDERWPAHCPIDQRHEDLKLEKIDQRIMRLDKDAWAQIDEENDEFYQETCNMNP